MKSVAAFCLVLILSTFASVHAENLKVVLLGDNGHHQPAQFYRTIQPGLAKVGIDLVYKDDVSTTLTKEALTGIDALMLYANTDKISPDQEKALLDYVNEGGAFVPVHCASFCFLNSEAFVDLVGAQFKEHGGQRFTTNIVEPDHEIMKGFGGFESWDETYIHHRHNTKDRIVLEERKQGKLARGTNAEPWTWIRTQGKGRVFYTAWGHNMDTWGQPGFVNLLERGIRWAAKKPLTTVAPYQDEKRFPIPTMTKLPSDKPPFTFTDVGNKIPNYRGGGADKTLNEMQNPLPPSVSAQRYVTPSDFSMKLWASEDDGSATAKASKFAGLAGKPLAMNWDHKGRLYLCETVDYPNELQPQGKGRDRIRICEDTDGDGTADKFTVFASGLSIPTAIVCTRGGAIVQDGPRTTFYKDIDGDDKADMKQVLITGWNVGDTHASVSNFQYGLDNWIWGMQGYDDSQPIINGEKQQRFRQGFWRFFVVAGASDANAPVYAIRDGKPSAEATKEFDSHSLRVTKLEFMRSTNNNTWGFGQSEDGLIFGSTANGNPSEYMPIPNRYYERVKGWSAEVLQGIADSARFEAITDKVRQVDFFGAYTAGAGHALYTARNYPKAWWNRVAFVAEPTGHLVGTFVLNKNGAGFQSTSPFNLVASDDEWASPTMAEVGPDGNVWVIDWYNFIVQHNPTPHGFETGRGNAYESDLRDKKHGRIYRVVYNGNEGESKEKLAASAKLVEKGLDPTNESQLVAALNHTNFLWRKHAQRLLIERGNLAAETFAALEKLVSDKTVDAVGLNPGATHAAWVLRAYRRFVPVQNVVGHPSPAVRRNVIQAADDTVENAKVISASFVNDSDAQVRLAAMLKLSDIDAANAEVAKNLVSKETLATTDRWLLDSWTSAASIHWKNVLPLLLQSDVAITPAVAKRIEIVAEHAARSRMTGEELQWLATAPKQDAVGSAVITGLSKGWPKDYTPTTSKELGEKIAAVWLKGNMAVETKSQILQLAQSIGLQGLQEGLSEIVKELSKAFTDESKSVASRVAAAKQAVMLQPENLETVEALLGLVSAQSSPDWSVGVLESMSNARVPKLAELLIGRSRTLTPDFQKNAIRLLMTRPQTTTELLDLMDAGKLTLSDLQLDQKQALRDHPNEKIRTRALEIMKSKGMSLNSDRQKVVEAWMDITNESGDVAHGKEMYQKHCALCHVHGSLGVQIGPNLTGMAVHPKAELLIHILDPSRSVEGNFRTYSVRTVDDNIVTGMLAAESKTAIEIVNVQAKREVVLREDIDELVASQKSLMPEGFESQMSKDDMKDLLEFLTSKGKYVPIGIQGVATSITTQGMFFEPTGTAERLVFKDWTPKTFKDVPFVLVDPQGSTVPNAIMLYGPNGNFAPKMPKQVELICETPAVAIHMLSGVGGWNFPASQKGSVSMIVKLTYKNGTTEDHPLINGVHFADYISRVDVPESEFAFDLNGRQIRYLSVKPKSREPLSKIELVKGRDSSAPVVMAITVQTTE